MPSRGNMFQRRHLDALASIVADIPGLTPFERRNVATHMAYRLRSANSPGVQPDRFISAACPDHVSPVAQATAATPVPVEVCGDCPDDLMVRATHLCPSSGQGHLYFCDRHAMAGTPNYPGCCRPL